MHPNHVPKVVDVCRERVDRNEWIPPKLWCGPIAAMDYKLQWVLVVRVVPTRQAKIGDVVLGRSRGARAMPGRESETPTQMSGDRVVEIGVEVARVHHDVRRLTVTVISVSACEKVESTRRTDVRHDANA